MSSNPYIEKMKGCVEYGLLCLVFLPFFLLLPSCAEVEAPFADAPNGLCTTTLRLDVASYSQGNGTTRGYVSGNSDENKICDIWVFQYNDSTGESMKNPVYLDAFDSNDIQVDLALNEAGEKSVVCIVANTRDPNWAWDENKNIKEEINTYEKLLQYTLPEAVSDAFISSKMGESGGEFIPMFGVSKAIAIVPKTYVSIPLIRMFARVEVAVDLSYPSEMGMKFENLVFRNIPFYCRVGTLASGEDKGAVYPDAVEWRDFDASGIGNDVILYIPENLQGKVSGMDSKQNASSGFPERALKVEITMSYEKEGVPRMHTYTVYPGLDMENDFNIKRNHIYDVNIKITKLPE